MKILVAASEVVGFAKTGGLADVAGALPPALARRGHECAVILPLYNSARSAAAKPQPTEHTFRIPIGPRLVEGRLWRSQLPGSSVPVYLVEQAGYFERDDPILGRGLYQFKKTDGSRADYPDNCERFVFFNRAVLEALRLLDFWPDVLHANDWQTGLLPVYLRQSHRTPTRSVSEGQGRAGCRYDGIRTLFTIHNIAFQGVFWHWDLNLTGLSWSLFNHHQLEYHGHISLLKGGIVFADRINTVSPTYAREIQTPYYGYGLHGVLYANRDRLSGIVNGVDYSLWDPAHDRHLAAHYTADALTPGKPRCKAELQRCQHLDEEPDTPLLGVVARLTEQKGIDLIGQAASTLLQGGVQLVVLGEGDPAYHRMFSDLRQRFPRRMGLTLGFNEPLAHRIEAGADLFLMPSQYEPSGLNQLYSLKYGTPPVVRATGGLADTVVDTNPTTLAAGTATGFSFVAYTPPALLETVQRALALYRSQSAEWFQVIRTGMRQDWSWERSALEYEKLYQQLVSGER
jgi:starch synthase